MNVVQRSLSSITWNITAQCVILITGFLRSILLARWLTVDVFGIYALAGSIVYVSIVIPNFGMAGALIHRAKESEDEYPAGLVHFTLICIFTLIWATVASFCIFSFAEGRMKTAMLVLMLVSMGVQLTQTPRIILIRRVQHRRLAIIQITTVLSSSVVALLLAYHGFGLWALLSTDIVMVLVHGLGFYGVKPFFKPKFTWNNEIVKYFLKFGSKNFLNLLMLQILNRIDKLWIGYYLGKTDLGFYSRAHRFANYPNLIFSSSVTSVLGGTFAELKKSRDQLSRVFFDANALLIRSGCFLAGFFILAAPELVLQVLGEKWMPMLDAFRYLLIFSLFSPIKMITSNLLVSLGKPEYVAGVRITQLVVVCTGLAVLGKSAGIEGVATALNIMLLIGIGILYFLAKRFVDFSVWKLFLAPALALATGMYSSYVIMQISPMVQSNVVISLVQVTTFTMCYLAVLSIIEFKYLLSAVLGILKVFRSRNSSRYKV